jgi:putative addiction module killer protein
MLELRGYINEQGTKRYQVVCELGCYRRRHGSHCAHAAGTINFSNVKGVGGGVLEYKIDFGPGYRIYFGKDGERLAILIGGGTKQRQDRDIAAALECWIDYKRRMKHAPYP